MTLPTTTTFGGVIFEVETSPGSGSYVARMCGFTDKGIALAAQTSSAIVPDCTNPEAVSWELSGVTAIGATITLSGIAAEEDSDFWNEWMDSGQSLNVRYRKQGVGFRAGALLLTDLTESVQLNSDANLCKRNVTAKNASAFPYTSGDPS